MQKLKKISLRVLQKDLLEGTTQTLTEGTAEYIKNKLIVYRENTAPFCKVEVSYEAERLVLKRFSEQPSTVYCTANQQDEVLIDTEYGLLSLVDYTHHLQIKDTGWSVEYEVRSEEEVVSHFFIEWQIKEDEA